MSKIGVSSKEAAEKSRLDAAFIVVDFIGLITGLVIIDVYFWLWIDAYYNTNAVLDDFKTMRFWIMPAYFIIAMSFFLVSLRWRSKRRDYALIGVLCWVFLYIFYKIFGRYVIAVALPFLVG